MINLYMEKNLIILVEKRVLDMKVMQMVLKMDGWLNMEKGQNTMKMVIILLEHLKIISEPEREKNIIKMEF